MATQGDSSKIAVIAGADLSAAQYKVVDVAGTIAANNTAALGILVNKPRAGDGASVAFLGHTKAWVGAAVSAGARLKTTTSGFLTNVASGDGSCAKALKAASSGSLCEVLVDFVSAATTY